MDFAVSFVLVLPFLSCSPLSSGNCLLERECCVTMRLKNKVFSKSLKPQVERNKHVKQDWERLPLFHYQALSDVLAYSGIPRK